MKTIYLLINGCVVTINSYNAKKETLDNIVFYGDIILTKDKNNINCVKVSINKNLIELSYSVEDSVKESIADIMKDCNNCITGDRFCDTCCGFNKGIKMNIGEDRFKSK